MIKYRVVPDSDISLNIDTGALEFTDATGERLIVKKSGLILRSDEVPYKSTPEFISIYDGLFEASLMLGVCLLRM